MKILVAQKYQSLQTIQTVCSIASQTPDLRHGKILTEVVYLLYQNAAYDRPVTSLSMYCCRLCFVLNIVIIFSTLRLIITNSIIRN